MVVIHEVLKKTDKIKDILQLETGISNRKSYICIKTIFVRFLNISVFLFLWWVVKWIC